MTGSSDAVTGAPSWSCAARSRELGEQLAGSAATATGWVCIEHPGGWGPRAPGPAELGEVHDALELSGVRVQLIRPVGRTAGSRAAPGRTGGAGARDGSGTTVLLAHGATDPARRWLRRLAVDDVGTLVEAVDPTVVLDPAPPTIGEDVAHDVWLVCTHGRRDACCAVHGRPVAAALDRGGAEVWETTHTGGHRFAATALLLPDGLALGRLDDAGPDDLAATVAGGVLPPALLRGRCAVPAPVQAAEALARVRLGITDRDGLLPSAWDSEADRTTVTLAGPAGSWRATIVSVEAAVARPVSDGADPTTPIDHRLVALDAVA